MPELFRDALRRVMGDARGRFIVGDAHLTRIDRVSDGFTSVRIHCDALATANSIPADAVKLHLPRRPGDSVPLPVYNSTGRIVLPSHHTGVSPAIRTLTLVNHSGAEAEFLVRNRPRGFLRTWIDSARPGDGLGLTGLRVEAVRSRDSQRLLVLADDSALPAAAFIARAELAESITVLATAPVADVDSLLGHLTAAGGPRSGEFIVFPTGHELATALRALAHSAAEDRVWIGVERHLARTLRAIAIRDLGVNPLNIHASAYWESGLDCDEAFENTLRRVDRARAGSADLSDPAVLQSLTFE